MFCPLPILVQLQSFFKKLMEKLMITERNNYLSQNTTKANGFYPRGLNTCLGEIENLKVPRTRDGGFHSQFLQRSSSSEDLDKFVHILFRSGVSTRNVEQILHDCFGTSLSHMTISQMATVAYEETKTWMNRPLQEEYAVLFIDAFYFPLKRDTVAQEAVYVIAAITPAGIREVLGFWIPGGSEGATNWEEILINLKNRGVKKVEVIVADGLTGIENAIGRTFPESKYQYCVLHAIRTSLNKLRSRDKQEISNDLKKIYLANNREEAYKALQNVKERWFKIYPKLIDFWEGKFRVLTAYMDLPNQLWRYVYTTNCIERLHKEIKRRINSMEQFQSEKSAEKILYMLFEKQNKRYLQSGINQWKQLYFEYQQNKDNQNREENVI